MYGTKMARKCIVAGHYKTHCKCTTYVMCDHINHQMYMHNNIDKQLH